MIVEQVARDRPSSLNSGDPSLLSALIFCNSLAAATDLVEDDIGCGSPDKGPGFDVPVGQPLINGWFQFMDAVEGSAADHLVGNEPEKAFHLVQPGTAGGREMKVEAAPLLRL